MAYSKLRELLENTRDGIAEITDILSSGEDIPRLDRALIWEIAGMYAGCVGLIPVPGSDEAIGANMKLIRIVMDDLESNVAEAEAIDDVQVGKYLGVKEEKKWDIDEEELGREIDQFLRMTPPRPPRREKPD